MASICCALFMLFSFVLYGINAANVDCRHPWRSYRSSCYYFSTDRLTWNNAFKQCKARQSYLVEIEDSLENAFLDLYLHPDYGCFFIGLSNFGTDGTWKWMTSGRALNFSAWGADQPDNRRNNENCVQLWDERERWNDVSCSRTYRYICEKKHCDALSITNANVSDSRTAYGTIVEISCYKGYNIIGNTKVECQADGLWSGSPTCNQIDVGALSVTNANVSDSRKTYGTVIETFCYKGYNIIGNTKVECNADGLWNRYPACNLIDCGPLSVTNANVSDSNTTYGTVVEISCYEGYTINGNSKVQCQADGLWSGSPTCNPIVLDKSTVEGECSGQSTVVGVVLGLIILILLVYAGYTTILIRRYRQNVSFTESGSTEIDSSSQCGQGTNTTNKDDPKNQTYVNESFGGGVANAVNSTHVGTLNSFASDGEPNTAYSALDDNTRDDRTNYDIVM